MLLIALPLVVLVTGCAVLLWNDDARRATHQMLAAIRAHLATLLVAMATATAAAVLAIVALHSLAD